jgi:transglutaminase-like putative cysteine protease
MHVFVAAARAVDIPARYVGGYFLRTDGPEQEAGHAWAEAYVGGVGWIGFDPANAVCADRRHIRVAVGRDYLEAAPIRGARFGGGGETLAVQVTVSRGREIRDQ